MSDFYQSRNTASGLLKTRRRGCGTAANDSTRALLPANEAGVCSPSAAFAAVDLPAQLARQGRLDPQASGSALPLHPRHFLSPFSLQSPFSYSAHHHLLSKSVDFARKANDFSLIKGFLHLSFCLQEHKGNSCLHHYGRQHLAESTTFTAFPEIYHL